MALWAVPNMRRAKTIEGWGGRVGEGPARGRKTLPELGVNWQYKKSMAKGMEKRGEKASSKERKKRKLETKSKTTSTDYEYRRSLSR